MIQDCYKPKFGPFLIFLCIFLGKLLVWTYHARQIWKILAATQGTTNCGSGSRPLWGSFTYNQLVSIQGVKFCTRQPTNVKIAYLNTNKCPQESKIWKVQIIWPISWRLLSSSTFIEKRVVEPRNIKKNSILHYLLVAKPHSLLEHDYRLLKAMLGYVMNLPS